MIESKERNRGLEVRLGPVLAKKVRLEAVEQDVSFAEMTHNLICKGLGISLPWRGRNDEKPR